MLSGSRRLGLKRSISSPVSTQLDRLAAVFGARRGQQLHAGRRVDGGIARAARLSASQVGMIEKIQKQAAPEVVAAVRSGDISLNAAAVVATLPEDEQRAAALYVLGDVAEIVARGEVPGLVAVEDDEVEEEEEDDFDDSFDDDDSEEDESDEE